MDKKENYVQLSGSELDLDASDLQSNQSNSSVRDRTQTPWHTNSPHDFANPHSKSNLFSKAVMHSETIAKWKLFTCYKLFLCLYLLLFSMAAVSSGELMRNWEDSHEDNIDTENDTINEILCDKSPISGDTKETYTFGDFSIARYTLYTLYTLYIIY